MKVRRHWFPFARVVNANWNRKTNRKKEVQEKRKRSVLRSSRDTNMLLLLILFPATVVWTFLGENKQAAEDFLRLSGLSFRPKNKKTVALNLVKRQIHPPVRSPFSNSAKVN